MPRSARQPIADRSIEESRRLIAARIDPPIPMLYFCPSHRRTGGSHVKFTQAGENSDSEELRDMFCHSTMSAMLLFRNFYESLSYIFQAIEEYLEDQGKYAA